LEEARLLFRVVILRNGTHDVLLKEGKVYWALSFAFEARVMLDPIISTIKIVELFLPVIHCCSIRVSLAFLKGF
jgi:hypothetical protein